ncbi:unnamed protein product [Heterobilharzia americana]|nr:unnamed protein product [Heterobilharzia americana]
MSGTGSQLVGIPVNCEQRTFEKQRRDLLNNLEDENNKNSLTLYADDWSQKINDWINSSWKRWNDDIQRLRRGMFTLLPLNTFGHVGTCDPLLLMNQLERQVDDIRNQICANDIPSVGSLNDYLKDAYEIGEDGKLHFSVRFDVKGVDPEDIKVTSTDNHITVQAKKEMKTNNLYGTREFCRMIQLPQSINHSQLKCNLTSDGVLMLAAPVSVPEHQSITFNESGQIGIRPKTYGQSQEVLHSKALVIKGDRGCSIVDDGSGNKRLHFEMPIDPIYKPEDLCITIDFNRLMISGRHCNKQNGDSGNHESFAEFSYSYEIPETIDPLSISAQLINDILVLEAPLVIQHKVM